MMPNVTKKENVADYVFDKNVKEHVEKKYFLYHKQRRSSSVKIFLTYSYIFGMRYTKDMAEIFPRKCLKCN